MKDNRGAQRANLRVNGESFALAAANQAMANRQPHEAYRLLDPWLQRPSAHVEVLLLAAHAQNAIGARTLALATLDRALRAGAGIEAHYLRGVCLRASGKTDEAIEELRMCLGDSRRGADAFGLIAMTLEEAGRYDEAQELLAPLVKAAEQGAALRGDIAYTWARLLVQKNRFDEAQAQITSTLKELNTTMPEMRRSLWYLRAKAFDRSKNYDQAMDAASKANMIGEVEFSPDLYTKQLSSLISNWTRQRMSRFPTSQCSSAIPVFVAGMPRSGTSLIDQIIDAHPLAAGVGELNSIDKFSKQLERDARPGVEPPACFGAMQDAEWTRMAEEYVAQITAQAPGAQRIVNKALGNNRLLGLIARLFPKTRIIHALRDPRDVAISCCMGGFNNKLFPWSTRMEWIARAWQGSREMMDHWKSSLDVPILEVSYERLVQQPDTEFPRIIEFLGLEWDEACTRFHESKRTVRTLSYDQVNRPLYTSSVSRHLNYAKSLQAIEWPRYDPNEIV